MLNRRFWNPLLALSGGLVLISGLFMLFRLTSRPIEVIHQLGAILFIIACSGHLIINWKPLGKTISKRAAWVIAVVLAFFAAAMAFSGFEIGPGHGRERAGWHRR